MSAPTTALGWSSKIFTLASGTMDDVSRSVASGAAIGVSDDATRIGQALGDARSSYATVLADLRGGASGTSAGRGFQTMVDQLEGVRRTATGRAAGHMHAAASEGAGIRAVVEGAGDITPAVDDALHMKMWGLRNQLDQAWNEFGVAKVMGQLR